MVARIKPVREAMYPRDSPLLHTPLQLGSLAITPAEVQSRMLVTDYGIELDEIPPRFAGFMNWNEPELHEQCYGDDVVPIRHGLNQLVTVVAPLVNEYVADGMQLTNFERAVLYVQQILHDAHEGRMLRLLNISDDSKLFMGGRVMKKLELDVNNRIYPQVLGHEAAAAVLPTVRGLERGEGERGDLLSTYVDVVDRLGYLALGMQAADIFWNGGTELSKSQMQAYLLAKNTIRYNLQYLRDYRDQFGLVDQWVAQAEEVLGLVLLLDCCSEDKFFSAKEQERDTRMQEHLYQKQSRRFKRQWSETSSS